MNYSIEHNDLKNYVCNMNQIAGITRSVLDDGPSRGIRVAEIRNGSGLNFKVLTDRGMDIGEASCCGIPLGWLSPISTSHPAFYDASGINWLRSWGGGLMAGCGMINVGVPSVSDNGEEAGLHGRLSNIPAENCASKTEWIDGRYVLSITGQIREARLFGENILLTRRISTAMGDNSITVMDHIKNEGCRPTPLMLLYHINIGYPMIDENAVLQSVDHLVVPRDREAEKGIQSWQKLHPPKADFAEQCFYHDIPVDDDGLSRIAVVNSKLGLRLEVAYRKNELPFFTQWKMMGQGEYAMGLEPANCHPEGQVAEKEKFRSLKIMQPDESIETLVKISVKCLD